MNTATELLYIGTNKHVLALDAATGALAWKTKLPGAGTLVSILVRPEGLFAASQGHAHRLDPRSGALTWSNNLPGMGYNHIMLGMMPYWEETATDALIAAAAAQVRQAAQSAG